MWKQPLSKWDSYIFNKNKSEKVCDDWSSLILKYCIDSQTAVYNSGGMYFKDFNNKITVIENSECPINLKDKIHIISDISDNIRFNNLILVNPITLKYNFSLVNFLTTAHETRGGWKPCLVNCLKDNNKIFLSFTDWHLYFDRFRYSVDDMVKMQIDDLEKNNFKCLYKQVDDVNLDVENGNIKLILEYKTPFAH